MFTFSRSKIATLLAGLTLVAAGNVAAADKSIAGVVNSVDYDTKTITLTSDKTGKVGLYGFTGTPKIDVNGSKLRDMSAVKPGQHVTLKLTPTEKQKNTTLIKGEILEVEYDRNIALIRPANGGAPRTIELPEDVSIAGLKPNASLKDLQKGQLVTLKYTAR